jgi:hypothetical protein
MSVPAGVQQPRPPRLFVADDILSGRVRLDGYPFRYILIVPSMTTSLGVAFGGRAGTNALLDTVLSASELLESQGWELVSIDHGGSMVCLRRR